MKATLKNIFLLLAMAYILETNINCAAGVVAAVFIPLISAVQWYNPKDATKQNVFFFNVQTLNSNTSDFTGSESVPGIGIDPTFKGSFSNHDIHFVYDGGSNSRKGTYTGFVNDSSTVITLTGDNASLSPSITLLKK